MAVYSEQSRQYGDDVVGLLKVKICSANLTRDTEMFGNMDPFCEFKINGDLVKKTAVKDEAGKTPVWDEEFDYQVKDLSATCYFQVLEEDNFSNDVVGDGTCSIQDLCQDNGSDANYPISFEGSSAGTVRLSSTWVNFQAAKQRLQQEEEERKAAEEAAAKAAAEAAEQERLEREAAEAAAEAERERLEAEEAERLAKEAADKAEQERLEAEEAERLEREAAEKAEQERLEAEEAERLAKEAADKAE